MNNFSSEPAEGITDPMLDTYHVSGTAEVPEAMQGLKFRLRRMKNGNTKRAASCHTRS
jgi:hypothetical protein